MEPEPLKPPSDAQAAGAFARTVRRFRGLTAQQVADGIGIPLRTYEYFESGKGRVNLDYIRRFAAFTDSDPFALLVGLGMSRPDLVRRCSDNKLMLVFMITLGEFDLIMGDRIHTLDSATLIEAFTETFRKLEAESREREEAARSWLEAGRESLDGKGDRPDDETPG